MSKKRGLSLEDKRQKMMELLYEKLKELEKVAPKEKGIVAQSVKDVIQSLVDDNLIDTDKIGTSVYYWAFPSKAQNDKNRKLEDLKDKLSEAKSKLKSLEGTLKQAKVGKEDHEERNDLVTQLEKLKAENAKLLEELKQHEENDPHVFVQRKEEMKIAKTAANRWTDNIFALQTWCKSKFYVENSVLEKQFGVPEDLDYLN